jgi:hypothetical protein
MYNMCCISPGCHFQGPSQPTAETVIEIIKRICHAINDLDALDCPAAMADTAAMQRLPHAT